MFRFVYGKKCQLIRIDEPVAELIVDALRHQGWSDCIALAARIVRHVRRKRSKGFALFEIRVSGRERNLIYDSLIQYKAHIKSQVRSINFIVGIYFRDLLIY